MITNTTLIVPYNAVENMLQLTKVQAHCSGAESNSSLF